MLDLIILAIIAFMIGSKLFKMLGKTDDDLPRRSDNSDVFAKHSKPKVDKFKAEIDIVSAAEAALPQTVRDTFDKIRKIDPSFSVDRFYTGAKAAFNMIINAFVTNDKDTLKHLLSSEVYKSFIHSIDARIAQKQTLERSILGINSMEVTEASISGAVATITVHITSDQISILKDHLGNALDGNKDMIIVVNDLWTFSRNLQKDNVWLLVGTKVL
jgi:predicted lipid-binding transport protein (Tim44 family)